MIKDEVIQEIVEGNRVKMSKDYGCKYCTYYHTIMYSGGKHRCDLRPEYILDRFTKRKPKWCPLVNIRKGNKDA